MFERGQNRRLRDVAESDDREAHWTR
jgi:hypothetical protein